MKKFGLAIISFALLILIGLAIGVWFIPFTMWSVGAAGVAIRVAMSATAQIILKSFITVICVGGSAFLVWLYYEFFRYF